MKDRIINIPKAFHELHGENSKLSSIILVYLAAIVVTSIFIVLLIPQNLPIWKYILVGLVYFDIAGGVVANLSSSTNQYYQRKKNLRFIFLFLHILQPFALYVVFPKYLNYFVFIFLFTSSSSLIVNLIKNTEFQQNIAGFFIVVGIVISFIFNIDLIILYSVAPLFMIKLILGFSVKRPSFHS